MKYISILDLPNVTTWCDTSTLITHPTYSNNDNKNKKQQQQYMITYLVPLSKAFDMAPVCLERWKLRSREWMC